MEAGGTKVGAQNRGVEERRNFPGISQGSAQNILRPLLMIHFPEDSPRGFDRKLGIGLALVVCFQSVAFNYTYGD
jgi:hypothetical protein